MIEHATDTLTKGEVGSFGRRRALILVRWGGWGVLGLMLLPVAGCGDSGPSYPVARLEGSVTIGGKPIPEGRIQFVPLDSGQGLATSTEIVDGRYRAEEVPLGSVSVMISATRETGRMITEYSTPYPEIVNIIPEKYRSGVRIDVAGDNLQQDFKLLSR